MASTLRPASSKPRRPASPEPGAKPDPVQVGLSFQVSQVVNSFLLFANGLCLSRVFCLRCMSKVLVWCGINDFMCICTTGFTTVGRF